MKKTCEHCGEEKHLQKFPMVKGCNHKIKSTENTQNVCSTCRREILAKRRLDSVAERKEWLNRAWV